MAIFELTNPLSGSSYFFMETKRNANGFYDAASPTNALGQYLDFTSIDPNTLVTSSYMFGVVVPPGSSSFEFAPTSDIPSGSVYLRATGDTTLVLDGDTILPSQLRGAGVLFNDEIYTYGTDFVMTIRTTSSNETFTIPTPSGTYNYDIEWGDGQTTQGATGDATHTYATSGDYDIKISGTFPQIYFNNVGDKDKLIAVKNLGVVGWTSFASAFYGCSNLETFVIGNTDTSSVTKMDYMFHDCSSLTSLDLSNWDVSSVTNMFNIFYGCSSLTTLDVSNWDVSSVANMDAMFTNCTSLTTIDVSNWDVSSVTDMAFMFTNCESLATLDVSGWDVSSVTDMRGVFADCDVLQNIDISGWDVSSVTLMTSMLRNFDNFDNDLSLWDITSVTNFIGFMSSATGLSTANYDATLIGWEATLQSAYPNGSGYTPSININFGGSQYTAGGSAETARDSLINNFNWTITDGGSV